MQKTLDYTNFKGYLSCKTFQNLWYAKLWGEFQRGDTSLKIYLLTEIISSGLLQLLILWNVHFGKGICIRIGQTNAVGATVKPQWLSATTVSFVFTLHAQRRPRRQGLGSTQSLMYSGWPFLQQVRREPEESREGFSLHQPSLLTCHWPEWIMWPHLTHPSAEAGKENWTLWAPVISTSALYSSVSFTVC